MEYYKIYSTWVKRILRLYKDVVTGPFQNNCSCCCNPWRRKTRESIAYANDRDEIIGFFMPCNQDPRKIGAENRFWNADEPHIITESALLFPRCEKHYPQFLNG